MPLRWPLGCVAMPPSPAMTRVLVVSTPTRPVRPVRGIVTPLSAGWFVTASSVSPCTVCQRISPLLRSMAEIVPHGGRMIGRLSMAMRAAPSPPPPLM